MIVFAIDPGTNESAFVAWDGRRVLSHAIVNNALLVGISEDRYIEGESCADGVKVTPDIMALEKIESYGMAVGAETFRTVFWSGRFAQAWSPKRFVEVTRREVKLHICGHARATDSNIRQALIDRFGAPGTKANKGLLYGLKGHEYAALAVAVTFYDQHASDGDQVRPGVTAEF